MKEQQIQEIHESLVNGQRKQMVRQIEEYGLYDFWEDYKCFLYDVVDDRALYYFQDATISYFRLKNR